MVDAGLSRMCCCCCCLSAERAQHLRSNTAWVGGAGAAWCCRRHHPWVDARSHARVCCASCRLTAAPQVHMHAASSPVAMSAMTHLNKHVRGLPRWGRRCMCVRDRTCSLRYALLSRRTGCGPQSSSLLHHAGTHQCPDTAQHTAGLPRLRGGTAARIASLCCSLLKSMRPLKQARTASVMPGWRCCFCYRSCTCSK